MRFVLIDRIIELTRGERIVAVKAVSLAEEYLADHFPTFPVLPGVFMLEAMTEAGTWLIREARDFAVGPVLLQRARNVTYKSFVKPGNLLTVTVTCQRLGKPVSEFSGVGHCNGVEVVRGRFSLSQLPAAGPDPVRPEVVEAQRSRFRLLMTSDRADDKR